ncbi:hypothetical protein CSA37_08825 [Candidatus Fermentibacteria bacterium]|nr:MAG: hypothetical protein CSA37_08825 [Candidatus Fermentibacteria bacterium]
MLYPGKLFAATVDGEIYRFDTETFQLDEVFKVGNPSPSGWGEMVLSPEENSAYLIGSMGTIVEISLPDCQVVNQFNICVSPVALGISAGDPGVSPGYLWVLDGNRNRMHQVKLKNNVNYGSEAFPEGWVGSCMADGFAPDTVYAGTSYGLVLISSESLGSFAVRKYVTTNQNTWDVARMHDDSTMVVVYGSDPSFVSTFGKADSTGILQGTVAIQGQSHITAGGNDYTHAYVLSNIGDGMSRLSQYNTRSGTIGLQTDIEGYPIDIQIGGTGMIYVLTSK